MARPEKNNVEYFPFLCKEGKAMFYIEQKYGNDGYASWVKILRQLAVTNYHFLTLSDKVEMMYMASKCKVTEETLINILNDLCDLGEFNKELWTEHRIVWNQKFSESVKDAYQKRSNNILTQTGLLILLDSLGIRKLGKGENITPDNTQTILDYIKLDYTKLDKTKEEKSKERDHVFENSILNFFGFSETANFNHARTVSAFVFVITEQGRLEYFKTQFDAYCKYKNQEGFKHAMKNYLGDQKNAFEDGLWDSENWTEKFEKLNSTPAVTPVPTVTGFVLGQKPLGAVNHAS